MPQPISMRNISGRRIFHAFLLPSFLILALFAYYPLLSAIYHSFFQSSGGFGLGNYFRAIQDKELWSSVGTLAILLVANALKVLPCVAIALAIHRLSDRWRDRYRVLLIVPMLVPGVVTVLLWKFFLDASVGVVNSVLDATGLNALLTALDRVFGWNVFHAGAPIAWLERLIIPSYILCGFPWVGTVAVLFFLARLRSIDSELYEAATLDGLSGWRTFFHIELPVISVQPRLLFVLLVIGTLKDVSLPYLLAGPDGGSGGGGMVPALWMFNRALIHGEFGYGCAIAVILCLFVIGLTWVTAGFLRTHK